jgi:hypothetical protein
MVSNLLDSDASLTDYYFVAHLGQAAEARRQDAAQGVRARALAFIEPQAGRLLELVDPD